MGVTHGLGNNANCKDDASRQWNNGIAFNTLEELKHYFGKQKQDSKQGKKNIGNVLVIGNNSDVKYDYFKYLNVYNALEKGNMCH